MRELNLLGQNLSVQIGPVLKHLWENGYYATLVGGAVRDYFLFGSLSHDLDFEIRSLKKLHGEAWEKDLSHFFQRLSGEWKVEKLSYSIYRFSYQGQDLEFSSPRVEKFIQGNISHKNFDVTLMSELSYEQSFFRRDFTVNAIGIEMKEDSVSLVDPYQGMKDLERKLLRAVSPDFVHDPVRFLRAIRFSFQLGFELSDELLDQMRTMDLSELSSHYVKTEMIKCPDPAKFWNRFKLLTKDFRTPLPRDLKKLMDLEVGNESIITLEEWVISCHLKRALHKDEFQTLVTYFQFSETKLKTLLSYYDQVKLISRQELLELKKKSLSEALKDPNLHLLLSLKDLMGKLKGKDLNFALTEEEKTLIGKLSLDKLQGLEEATSLQKSHNIPETYTGLVKIFTHLNYLSL